MNFSLRLLFFFQGLKGTIEDFKSRNQPLIFLKLKPQVKKILKAITDIVCCDALDDIGQILLGKKYEYRIFKKSFGFRNLQTCQKSFCLE